MPEPRRSQGCLVQGCGPTWMTPRLSDTKKVFAACRVITSQLARLQALQDVLAKAAPTGLGYSLDLVTKANISKAIKLYRSSLCLAVPT